MSNGGVVDDQFAAADELQEFIDDVGELRLVGQEFQGDAVYRLGAGVDLAFRVDVFVQMAAGQPAVFHLDAGDFDDAVTRARVEAGGFGIEDDLSHFSSRWLLVGELLAGFALVTND